MSPKQYDLFGEVEAEEARAASWKEWIGSEKTCPLCGDTEPNGILLSSSHGFSFDHDGPPLFALDGSECTRMWLSRNHVLWAAGQPDPSLLEQRLSRARHVWRNHLDALAASLADHGLDPNGRPA